jgi:K+ transporter
VNHAGESGGSQITAARFDSWRRPAPADAASTLADVTYYVGYETVVPSDSDKRLPRWLEVLFAAMQRNSAHVTDYFKLPRTMRLATKPR